MTHALKFESGHFEEADGIVAVGQDARALQTSIGVRKLESLVVLRQRNVYRPFWDSIPRTALPT